MSDYPNRILSIIDLPRPSAKLLYSLIQSTNSNSSETLNQSVWTLAPAVRFL